LSATAGVQRQLTEVRRTSMALRSPRTAAFDNFGVWGGKFVFCEALF